MRAARQVAIVDQGGAHLRYIARTEAQKMLGTREVTYLCRHCRTSDVHAKTCEGRVKPHSMVYTATALYRNIRQSRPSITFREMLANVGAAGSQAYQAAVRGKVEAFDPSYRPYCRFPQPAL